MARSGRETELCEPPESYRQNHPKLAGTSDGLRLQTAHLHVISLAKHTMTRKKIFYEDRKKVVNRKCHLTLEFPTFHLP